jgi:hypothetical protein
VRAMIGTITAVATYMPITRMNAGVNEPDRS